MTRTQLETGTFTHQEVVDSIYHLASKQMDDGIMIKALKVTDIDLKGLNVIAFTKTSSDDCSLWSVEFKFVGLKNHTDFVIQNCSRVVKAYELPERRNFIDIQGLSPVEANGECFKFFLGVRTFEQKRQLNELQKLQSGV